MDHHGEKCVAASAASNIMDLMMRLSNTKTRAVAANKVALEAEQATDALEREVGASDENTTD